MSAGRCIPFGLVLLTAPSAARADDDPAVAPARPREHLVRSIRVELHLHEVIAPDSGQSGAASVPDSDNRILLDGARVRVEDAHPQSSGVPGGRPQPRQRVFVWDGATGRALITAGSGPMAPQMGHVDTSLTTDQVWLPTWLPLVLTVRGLNLQITSHALTGVSAGTKTHVIDGRPSREYVHHDRGQVVARLWLDPQSGFVPRQVVVHWPGNRVRRLDIEHRSGPTAGWLPTEWALSETDPGGRPSRTLTVTVTAVRVNEPIADDQFGLTFPPGATVNDERVGRVFPSSRTGVGGKTAPEENPLPAPRRSMSRPGGGRWPGS